MDRACPDRLEPPARKVSGHPASLATAIAAATSATLLARAMASGVRR